MKAAVTVKENYEFRRIYRKGKSLVSPQMVLYWQKNRQGQSRLGITVSTKLGHAVSAIGCAAASGSCTGSTSRRCSRAST